MLLRKNRPFDYWLVVDKKEDGRLIFHTRAHSYQYCMEYASKLRYSHAKYNIPGHICVIGCYIGDVLECLICGSYSFIKQIDSADTCPRCGTSLAPFVEVGL